MGGTARLVDVLAVGRNAHRDDLRAQFPECGWGDLISSAIGAIDRDLQPVEAHRAGQRTFHRVDIAPARILDTASPADILARGQRQFVCQQAFDGQLVLVGKLEAVRPEQFDAIVFIRIVTGRDHHANIRTQFARQQGDGRRWHRPQQDHVHAHTGKARGHRVFQHITRKPRVLADDNPVAVRAALKQTARGLPHLHRHRGGHRALIGAPANTVSAEVLPTHACLS